MSKLSPNERRSMISKRVAMIFAAYRVTEFSDPAGAAASMSAVLEDYPDDVIRYVSDPKTGIQRKCKWPPTINELVEFCDEHVAYLAKLDRFNNWGKADAAQIEPPRQEKPTLAELKAKYGENWGIDQGERPAGFKTHQAPSWERIAEQYHGDPDAMKRLTAPLMTRAAVATKKTG
jgi:hypothetical protein